jgi:predicted dehydrogenase
MSTEYSRRHFLGRSAAVTAVGLTKTTAAAPSMPRVGHIGVGNRGSMLLSTGVRSDQVKIVAICDLREDRLKTALEVAARDSPKGYSEYRRMLEDKSIDAIFIATPCYLHREMVIDAVQAGKHVYCEKPLATTAADCNATARAVRSSGRIFQIGQQLRYSKTYRASLEKIHEGFAGKLLFIRSQRHHSSRSVDPAYAAAKPWLYDRVKSGDTIVENAVHEIDVLNWLNGAYPLKACGMGGCNLMVNQPAGRSVTDHYIVTWEYPNGVHATYTQANYTHPSVGGGRYEQAHFSKMSVEVGAGRFYEPGNKEPVFTVQVEGKNDMDLQAIQAFVDSIRNNRKPFADIEVARQAALASILGRTAFYEGRTVRWEELGG